MGAHQLGTGILSAGISFGPSGEVLEVVDTAGSLTQFDSTGSHLLGSGVQSADVASGPLGQVLAVVFTSGDLFQFDAMGAHQLGTGVLSASLAFGPSGKVLAIVTADPAAPAPEPASWAFAVIGIPFILFAPRRANPSLAERLPSL